MEMTTFLLRWRASWLKTRESANQLCESRSVDSYRMLPSLHTYNVSASLCRDSDITHM